MTQLDDSTRQHDAVTGSSPAVARIKVDLLPYHTRIIEFLRRHDREVWQWFASSSKRTAMAEELKFDLLKSTYRIDRDTQSALYETADEIAGMLGLTMPITLYQAQNPAGLNASLAYHPAEIHIILHGPIATELSENELRALLGHELTHFQLWHQGNGDLWIASEMLIALTNDARARPAHFASWRLLQLYNEIICDRGAFLVSASLTDVVSMLVKILTGVRDIRADSFLRQADEIFSRGTAKVEGLTHPEAHVRARALRLWVEHDPQANDKIVDMIESKTELQELDLLAQEVIASWTRRTMDLLLSRKWLQSEPVLAHARLFFDDYVPPCDPMTDPQLTREMRLEAPSVLDYFCFLLLDFVGADRDLDEPSLAAALDVAEQLGMTERFSELARRELRLRKNQLEKIADNRTEILREADQSAAATR